MVCSAGSRAVSARSTVRPPTPLSKTPMGASIGLQDACTGYLEKGIFQEAEAWLGTANRTCEWKAPAIASIPHRPAATLGDRKSTRLNSSHDQISYAVFCLKKKKHRQVQRPILNVNESRREP